MCKYLIKLSKAPEHKQKLTVIVCSGRRAFVIVHSRVVLAITVSKEISLGQASTILATSQRKVPRIWKGRGGVQMYGQAEQAQNF